MSATADISDFDRPGELPVTCRPFSFMLTATCADKSVVAAQGAPSGTGYLFSSAATAWFDHACRLFARERFEMARIHVASAGRRSPTSARLSLEATQIHRRWRATANATTASAIRLPVTIAKPT